MDYNLIDFAELLVQILPQNKTKNTLKWTHANVTTFPCVFVSHQKIKWKKLFKKKKKKLYYLNFYQRGESYKDLQLIFYQRESTKICTYTLILFRGKNIN